MRFTCLPIFSDDRRSPSSDAYVVSSDDDEDDDENDDGHFAGGLEEEEEEEGKSEEVDDEYDDDDDDVIMTSKAQSKARESGTIKKKKVAKDLSGMKRPRFVPSITRALQMEKEAKEKEQRGLFPPISDLGDIFADIVRRTPEVESLAKTLQGRPLRVATMCSGTESPLLALRLMSRAIKERHGIAIEIEHVFSCEIEPYKQAYIERNFAPPILFRDVCELGQDQAHTAYGALVDVPGNVDLLVAGTSCVDYSNLNNKKKGIEDGGESGRTFFGMLDWVKRHQPTIVILENVMSAPWEGVKDEFISIGYDSAYSTRFDTKNYYIPHTRQRGYLIATKNRKDWYADNWEALARSLARPASCTLESFLLPADDPRIQRVRTQFALGEGFDRGRSVIDWSKCQGRHERARDEEELGKARPFTAWEEGGTCKLSHGAWNEWAMPMPERVLDLLDITVLRFARQGIDAHYKSRIWELSQNVDRNIASARPGVSNCITPTGMPYLTGRGGPMVGLEALSLQGLPIDELLLTRETNDQLQNLAGNAMSSTVVGTCILAALVIARPDLAKTREGKCESMDVDKEKGDADRSIRFDGQPGTRMVGALSEKKHDIVSCETVDMSELLKMATSTSMRCDCEGRMMTTKSDVYRCKSCDYTTCASCKGRPEHDFELDHRSRLDPDDFAGTVKACLPMRFLLGGVTWPIIDEMTEATKQKPGKLFASWAARVTEVLSDGVELRFNELLRQRRWLACYSGHGIRLELCLDPAQPHWRLFVEATAVEPAGSPLRKLLLRPVARMLLDPAARNIKFLEAKWQIFLPFEESFRADILLDGPLVPTWEASLGLEGDIAKTRRYSAFDLVIPQEVREKLDDDISGHYQLLAKCGTANGALHVRRSAARERHGRQVFFFLDTDRFRGQEADRFVFTSEIERLPFPKERVVVARCEDGWKLPRARSANVSNAKEAVSGLQKSIVIALDGQWVECNALTISTPQELRATLGVPLSSSIQLPNCRQASVIVSSAASIHPSARNLWPHADGFWHEVDLEHRASMTFRSLAWLTERVAIPAGLLAYMPLNLPSAWGQKCKTPCQGCAPAAPDIQWLQLPKKQPLPMENDRQAGPYEQALKRRPAPFVVQLRVDPSSDEGHGTATGKMRIGVNPLTLAHRALARLPRNDYVIGQPCLSWRLAKIDKQLNLFNLPKYTLRSNRGDAEADNPRFFKLELRREQKRSLTWMLAQESDEIEPFQEEEVAEGMLEPMGWRVEGKASRKVSIKGGVLADAVGYGKTAITLGLIASTRDRPAPVSSDGGFIETRATLIIVPPHLCGQWRNEITKFLGSKFRVEVIHSKAELNKITVEDLCDAHIVIMSVTVYKSDAYFEALARLAAANPLPAKEGRFFDSALQLSLAGLRNRVRELKSDGSQKVWQSISKRVDFDSEHITTSKASKRIRGQVDADGNKIKDGKKRPAAESEEDDSDDFSIVEEKKPQKTVSGGVGSDIWGLKSSAVRKDWKQMQSPPLEAFHWARVVVDEFHYIAEEASRAFSAIRELKSDATWILSGTPPTADFADVKGIAAFLKVHLGVDDDEDSTKQSVRRGREKERSMVERFRNFVEVRSPAWHHRRQAIGQKFLDRFVRQNVAEIDEIPFEILMRPVRMPAAERACYLELAHTIEALDLRLARRIFKNQSKSAAAKKKGADGVSDRDERLRKTLGESSGPEEALSRQASHFVLDADDTDLRGLPVAQNAIEACEFIVGERTRQRDEVLEQLERELKTTKQQHFKLLLERNYRDPENQAPVKFAKNVESYAWGDEDCRPKLTSMLSALEFTREGLSLRRAKEVAGKVFKPKKPDKDLDWEEEVKIRNMAHLLQRLRNELWSREQSLRYFTMVRDVQKARSLASRVPDMELDSGIVCPGDRCELKGKSMTMEQLCLMSVCGHGACHKCMLTNAYVGKCCTPGCHGASKPTSIVRASTLGDDDKEQATYYGMKLAQVATLIKRKIAQEDRVLLFVQFDGLLKKVDEALTKYKIKHIQMKGSAVQRSNMLERFQGGDERVLLLNIADESAAGSNLTVANHVIFLSPLVAEHNQQYAATMEQAKGRAIRFGQTKEVKVWRFFVRETIDASILEQREGMRPDEIEGEKVVEQVIDV